MSDFGMLMNEKYSYEKEEEIDLNAFSETKENDHGEKKFKIVKIVFFVLCLFLVGELVVYKYVMPCFSSPKVTVNGYKLYTAQEIASKLIPMNSSTWMDFDVEQAMAILTSDPGFDVVSVNKKFPDKIYIDVVERVPVAVTFVEEEGSSTPVQIDKNGVLFPVKDNVVLDSNAVPIISGLPVEHVAGGMRIPTKYRPLIDQISRISELGKNYFACISEIHVIPKTVGTYELELIPAQSKIRVLTDRALNEDALKYMMVVLDVVNQLDTEVTEVDLRYGAVSCKTK